jgi:hypothetical protein
MDKYDIEENDIGNLKLKMLKAMILAGQDVNKVEHDGLKEILHEILANVKQTNGRVTCLEKSTRFWTWFSENPLRLAIFFLIPLFCMYIFSIESIWTFVEKIFKLL